MPGTTQLLSNLVSVQRANTPVIVNHYNVWPVYDVYANVDRRDLGGVGRDVERIMREEEPHLPRGTSFTLRGQIETMQSSFFRLGCGHGLRGRPRLSSDDRKLPVLARSVHHSYGAARRLGWNIMDVVRDRTQPSASPL